MKGIYRIVCTNKTGQYQNFAFSEHKWLILLGIAASTQYNSTWDTSQCWCPCSTNSTTSTNRSTSTCISCCSRPATRHSSRTCEQIGELTEGHCPTHTPQHPNKIHHSIKYKTNITNKFNPYPHYTYSLIHTNSFWLKLFVSFLFS